MDIDTEYTPVETPVRDECAELRAELESETRWARQYHDEAESLREQLETMTLARDVMESERDGLRQAKQDSEAQGARNYAELMEARAEVERLRKEVDEIEDIERMALAMLHGGHTMPSTLYHRLLERERIAAEVTP